ncbi:MAG: hypothetical protein WKG06_12270 [Segetibacter sp.]
MKKFLLRIFYANSVTWALILISGVSAYSQPTVRITGMKCEYLLNPIGIDAGHPRLLWQMDDSSIGASQTACRVIVGKDSLAVSKLNGTSWDSKKLMEPIA